MQKEKKFTILNVLDTTIDNFWLFLKTWKVWFLYVLALTFLGAICGSWSHSCKDSLSMSWWCVSLSSVFAVYARIIIYFFVSVFLIFAFCYDIYNGQVGFKALFSITKKKLTFMGFSAGLCGVFFIFLGIDVWLVFRKANPDWIVEFGFFLIVFTLATLAVLILRTSASLGLFLLNGKMPDFRQIFKLTHGKFYVVLITFCIITFFVNLLQMRAMGFLEAWNIRETYFYVALISEFFSSALKFAVLAVYVAYFLSMAQCLFPQEPVENTEKPAINIKNNEQVKKLKTKTKKPAKKTKVK